MKKYINKIKLVLKYIKLFEEFSKEDSLKKVYLAFREDSGQRWWTYKGFAGDKFFTRINENNIDKIDINPDYPVLNYHSDTTEKLLKAGKIKEENIYNHPKHISKSGSKEEFHKLVGEDENIPKTVYSKNDALEKLDAGADLIQLYTGFIYEGPKLIKDINKALQKSS